MMCAWFILFCPPHNSRGVGLVGGNPTMNTLPQVYFLLGVVYFVFVTQLPSWSDGL